MTIHEIILASIKGDLPIDVEKLAPIQAKVDDYLHQAVAALDTLENDISLPLADARLAKASYRHEVALFQELAESIANRVTEAVEVSKNRKQFQL